MLLRMKIPLSAVRLFSPSLGFTPAWPACGCPKSLQAILSVPGHHLINWLHIPACDLECFRSLLGRCVRFRRQAAKSAVCIPFSISELTFIAPLCGSLIDSIHCCITAASITWLMASRSACPAGRMAKSVAGIMNHSGHCESWWAGNSFLPIALPCGLPSAWSITQFLPAVHASPPGLQLAMVVFPAS